MSCFSSPIFKLSVVSIIAGFPGVRFLEGLIQVNETQLRVIDYSLKEIDKKDFQAAVRGDELDLKLNTLHRSDLFESRHRFQLENDIISIASLCLFPFNNAARFVGRKMKETPTLSADD